MLAKKNGKTFASDPEIGKHSPKTQAQDDLKSGVVVAPDGGYGWVILIAAFVINVIVDGNSSSFGPWMSELTEKFHASVGSVAWVGSMMGGFPLLAGPIVSGLCNRFGARIVTVYGSILAVGCIAISTYSQSLEMMLCFYGMLGGIGFGMVYFPAIVIVGQYFEKRRAFATGLVVCGSGIGGFIFPALWNNLLEIYDWRGSLLIIAGIALNCAVCGALFRPLKATIKAKVLGKSDEDVGNSIIIINHLKNDANNVFAPKLVEIVELKDVKQNNDGCSNVLRNMFDLSLLKSPTFLLTCISSFLTMAAFYTPFVFIIKLVTEVAGLTNDQGVWVLMAIGITNTLGRILVGLISDHPKVDPILVACFSLVLGGIATCFAPFYSNLAMFLIYALFFGLATSAFSVLRSIILVDLFGIEMLNNSFGLQMVFQGVAALVGSPIAGILVDLTGTFTSCFYFAGVLLTLSGGILLPARLILRWEKGHSDEK